MTTYTDADFAQARFAEHPDGRIAMRSETRSDMPWKLDHDRCADDGYMAHKGWSPIFELGQSVEESIRDLRVSRDTQNLVIESYRERDDRLRADVRGQATIIGELRERLQAADDVKDMLRGTVDDLREKVKQLEATQRSPLSLDTLEAVWEAAEVPTDDNPIRQGDVCLVFLGATWIAGEVGDRWWPVGDTRILSRAPKREPWADLEDVLRDEIDLESDPGGIAHALHLKGWRKGGGDQ